VRDHDGSRHTCEHVNDNGRYECGELSAYGLGGGLVTGAHLRLRGLVGLVVGTLALVRIRTAARDSIIDRLELRERHAEGEQDRDKNGHPFILVRSGSFEQHASAFDRPAEGPQLHVIDGQDHDSHHAACDKQPERQVSEVGRGKDHGQPRDEVAAHDIRHIGRGELERPREGLPGCDGFLPRWHQPQLVFTGELVADLQMDMTADGETERASMTTTLRMKQAPAAQGAQNAP
jgi:hypothetical protein